MDTLKGGFHDASKFARSSQKGHALSVRLGGFGAGVASVPALDVAALRQRWKALFGADPSPHVGRSLMVRAIAYRLQEKALGGLKPATQRLLDRILEGRSEIALERIPNRRASAGTVLIRQWRGVQSPGHRARQRRRLPGTALQVAVGSRPRDHRHPLVGTLFFGLKRRAKEAANG